MENDKSECVALVYQNIDAVGYEVELRGRDASTWYPHKVPVRPASAGALRSALRQGREFCQRMVLDELNLGNLRFIPPWTQETWDDFQMEIEDRLGAEDEADIPRLIFEDVKCAYDVFPRECAEEESLWRDVIAEAFRVPFGDRTRAWRERALIAETHVKQLLDVAEEVRKHLNQNKTC